MSLLADIANVVRTVRGETNHTPVRYTTESDRGWGWGWGTTGAVGVRQQLDLTTSESTLMSVLKLISGDVASCEWEAFRKQKNPDPNKTRVPVTAEQSLAVKLWEQPNPFMSGVHVRKVCSWHYAAVGEAWAVIDYWDEARTLPRAWWPVRPDRMTPIPDPEEFLVGYIYTGPDGKRVPLELDEVLRITDPHPLDPHRGIGAVQTLGTALGTSLSSQQWISAFFRNDATPGGIIELGEGLEDADFQRLRSRWNEDHRGVNRAHRVAILEYGKWIPTTINMKEMQFTEIRNLTRDQILEAFRIHKHMMGASDDVNLANATAADMTYAKRIILPPVKAWKALANGDYLKAFGPAAAQTCFEPENPVPEDEAAEQAELASMVSAAVALTGAGADWDATLEAVGLPPIPRAQDPVPAQAAVVDPVPEPAAVEGAEQDALAVATVAQKLVAATQGSAVLTAVESRTLLVDAGASIIPADWVPAPSPAPFGGVPAASPPGTPPADQSVPPPPPTAPGDGGQAGDQTSTDTSSGAGARVDDGHRPQAATPSPAADVDLTKLGEDWQKALDKVLAKWPKILTEQYTDLERQVRSAIEMKNLDGLLQLVCIDAGSTDILTAALVGVAATGAAAVVREAKAQGVKGLEQVVPFEHDLRTQARLVTGFLRQNLATSAGREALRVQAPGVPADEVATAVRAHLDQLTDVQPRTFLGGALTSAQSSGRFETFKAATAAGVEAVFYASEQLDDNTCKPCRKEDGKKLGTTIEDTTSDYPGPGYVKCEGRERCRGMVVAKWTVGGGE